MERSMKKIDVYLEVGKKRSFAGAIEWPGWCRSGRDEESALEALREYGLRYSSALRSSQLEFRMPVEASEFTVIERLEGDATTDFGSPGKTPSSDMRPVDDSELRRYETLLKAFWQTLDAAASAATGKELRKGPRGGGRDLKGIIQHVLDAEVAYLGQIGWKIKKGEEGDPEKEVYRIRQMIIDALAPAARGELPAQGPRGGIRWTPRYFVRRVAWHVLDHAWEIEDRIL